MKGLDIFCGLGGSSAGARAAGVEMVGAIDMCPIATENYRCNFPQAHVVRSKLEDVSAAAIQRQIGAIDILLASPECTNHTPAKGSAPRSEESRATAMHVVKYARAFKPRWLVVENVVNMKPWTRYQEFCDALRGLGYNLKEQVLDASMHGVPQSRKRLYLVGDRHSQPRLVEPMNSPLDVSAASILDPAGTWPTSPLFSPRRAKATLARADRAFSTLGGNKPFLLVYYGTDGSGGWQTLQRPLRTITTVDRFALIEPSDTGPQMRMLQVSELRRAMGIPDSYLITKGTRRDRVRLLGNGVCPPVMERVVRALTSSFDAPLRRIQTRRTVLNTRLETV